MNDAALDGKFLFVVCAGDSQNLCKRELLRFPELKFSFSRRGFLTYKVASENWPEVFDLQSTFARTYGFATRRVDSDQLELLADQTISQLDQPAEICHLHVWSRITGKYDDLVKGLIDEIKKRLRQHQRLKAIEINRHAKSGQQILDLVLVDPGQWWFGHHTAAATFQRWPGGVPLVPSRARQDPPTKVISRAYFKLAEAIAWSGMPISRGDWCAEIGSAPGGSCQRLLELGVNVIAIDPANLHEQIAGHPSLTHLKMRGRDVPHNRLKQVKWLLVDSNAAPLQTLDTVEGLVAGKQTNIRGLLLTLKFSNLDLVERIEDYVKRVKSWGFQYAKTRQLSYGRQEVCLMAMRRKSIRRFGR